MAWTNPWLQEGAVLGLGYVVVAESTDSAIIGPPQVVTTACSTPEAAARDAYSSLEFGGEIKKVDWREDAIDSLARGELETDRYILRVVPVTITVRKEG